MKKILFFAASASLLLAGCSKEVAEAPSVTTDVDPYEVKPIRIHINGNPYEWTNYDNPNRKMTVCNRKSGIHQNRQRGYIKNCNNRTSETVTTVHQKR